MRNLEIKNTDCHAALAMTKSVQSGRSMIEMLGVLAIIGVLSVGGIAGYSKAMMKYRINKTIEQITLTAGNIHSFFAPQGNYDGLDAYTGKAIIKKAKLVPDEMWNETEQQYYNEFGNYFNVGGSAKTFSIGLAEIPSEACIELATQDWTPLNAKTMMIDSYRSCAHSDLSIPLDMATAVSYCSECAEKNGGGTNMAYLTIYFE